MILDVLGLTTSGIVGAIFSELSDWRRSRQQHAQDKTKLQLAQEARLQGQTFDFLNEPDGFVTSPIFAKCFFTLVRTYCICIIICLIFPDQTIWTFNPNTTVQEFSIAYGLFVFPLNTSEVYRITLGGVAYGLLHLLAFQIGTVITGVYPTNRQRGK